MFGLQAVFKLLDWVFLPAITFILNLTLPVHKELLLVKNFNQSFNSATHYPVLNFVGLVEQHGYTAEEFVLNTTDGYILTLHRISGSPRSPKAPNKPVVYLQHGIFLSSDSWVLTGPNTDLAFLLVDAGKDVWIGNVRGNTYCQTHVNKNLSESEFWKFGYHEMAVYDIRAIVDYIIKTTGQKDMTFIGYSMGTTLSYVFLSTFPQYNENIKLLHSISPVVFWKHELRRLTKLVRDYFQQIDAFVKHYNLNRLLPQSVLAAELGRLFCKDGSNFQSTCAKAVSSIGLDINRMNRTALPDILAHFPAGTSTITTYHYHQNFIKGTFQAYDYDQFENVVKYGQATPPVYNLSRVTVPVSIWYGKNDDIVNDEDVLYLKKRLPNVISYNEVQQIDFNHFDFLWALDVKELVYDKLIRQLP